MAKPGANYEPHHIVAANDPRAAPAQAILDRASIGLDEAENGVWLPRVSKGNTAAEGFTDHGGLHSDAYFKYVNQKLTEAGPDGARQALTDLYLMLKEGKRAW